MKIDLNETASVTASADRAPTTPAELDEALLREIGKGNQLAMRTLFMRHQLRVYRFALRFVRDRGLAEDVVSEAFFAVWRQAHRFKGRSTVSTWLLSIARHKALTAVKRQPMERLDDATAAAIADPALGAEATIDDAENGAILRRCVEALSVEHGEMIDLVYYQRKSIKEIAEILAIPSNTVKTRMFYARKRLAALLEAADADCDRM
jgi:RNA polymerase sigma-70 factor (ECF subfamily)